MATETIPYPTPSAQAAGVSPDPLRDRLLIDITELARVTSLSVRTLRRMDAAEDIPGRVVVGRRVLFQTEIIREWVRAGLLDREQWSALQKRNGKR